MTRTMNSNPTFQTTKLPEFFRDSLMKYLKYWYIFLMSILLSLTAAFIYLNLATPSYKISSTLLVQDDKKGDGELKGSAFNDLNMFRSDKKADNEMEILRSRDLIYKVLKSLSLETSYFQKNEWREKELYQELPIKIKVIALSPLAYEKKISIAPLNEDQFYLIEAGQRWVFEYGKEIKRTGFHLSIERGNSGWENHHPIRLKFNNLYTMAEAYSLKKLSVLPVVKDANTLVLSLQDAIPQRGIDILKTLIKTYNEENVIRKNAIAVNTINFIDKRLAYLSRDLSIVEQDVESYKQANMVTDPGADAQSNLLKSGEYQQLKSNAEVQLKVIEALQNYLAKPDNQFKMVPSSLSINNLTLNELSSKFNALQQERNRMLRTSSLNNPLVISLTEQLSTLKSNIEENLQNIKQGIWIERNNLAKMSSAFSNKIRSAPVVERGLLERSREQGVKMSLYHYLLQKREETTLSLSGTVPSSEVIDQPAYHSVPVSPKKQLSYLYALVFGCFAPAVVIYGKSLWNHKVRDAHDIEALTGVRLLGVLNHVAKDEQKVLGSNSRTTISELFRYIRSNLHFMSSGLPNQVLLITSCLQAEGKTFFSLNLGMTLAAVRKKVLLMEFDLRKPDLLERMKMKPGPGITEYLNGEERELMKLIRPAANAPNLYVIGCGSTPDHPSELMLHPEIGLLMEELRTKFDYIIIDSSPVGQVADAFSLAPYTDASIYLVRYNYTDKFHLNILRDIYVNQKLNQPMVVFNDAKNDYKQGYGYGYSSYNPLPVKIQNKPIH